LGFAIFFVFLFPTSHVIDFGALMAERFLFAPSLGFVVLAVVGTRRALAAWAGPRGAAIGAIVWVLVAGVGAAQSRARAVEWRDEVRLWSAAAGHISGDIRVHTNLAAAYLDRRELDQSDLDAAKLELERALDIDPDYVPALGNLAIVELDQGRVEAAMAIYHRLLEIDPDDYLTWNNLGIAETRRGNHRAAIKHFERALEINSNFAFARGNLDATQAALALEEIQGSR
jgi:tetratricopeptide (TPR) repeat protein